MPIATGRDRRDRMGEKPIIHRSKLFGGQATAQELHRKLAWNNANCDACGNPAAIQVQVFVAFSDMSPATREGFEALIAAGQVKPVMTAGGKAIRVSCRYACSRCQPALERAAARSPKSYFMVDIDRGPVPDRPIVSVL